MGKCSRIQGKASLDRGYRLILEFCPNSDFLLMKTRVSLYRPCPEMPMLQNVDDETGLKFVAKKKKLLLGLLLWPTDPPARGCVQHDPRAWSLDYCKRRR